MSTFVLVHGAWHGAWCWDQVAAELQGHGHRVIAPDLPGHGDNRCPLEQVSLQAYAGCVGQCLEQCDEKAVLVGHSMGGLVISQAAEINPQSIRTLVYLAAILLPDGGSLMSFMGEDDPEAIIPANLIPSQDGLSMTLREEVIREAFYAECSDDDVARAREKLCPQATAPLADTLKISDERFGLLPRVYIECLRDKAVPLKRQRTMQAQMPCQSVISIDTDHSPFFSAAGQLASHLESIAADR